MPVDPRVLQAIGDPTGGRLTGIGQIYAKSKQQAVESKQKQQIHEFKMNDMGSKTVLAYADTMKQWEASEKAQSMVPGSTEYIMEYSNIQKSEWDKLDDVSKAFVPEGYQTPEQIDLGHKTALNMQKRYHPENYTDDSLFTKPDASKYTKESRVKYEKSGLQSDLVVKPGRVDGKSTGAQSGYIVDSEGNRVTSGFMSGFSGEVRALENGSYRKLRKGEEFIKGEVQDTSEGLGFKKQDFELFKEDLPMVELSDELAESARIAMPRIDLSIDMYKKGLIEGGALTEFMTGFRNYFKSVTGFDLGGADDPTSIYTATATAKSAQLTKTKDLKGAISEKELTLSGQATGIAVDNPAEAALLNLKILKMAHIRESKYNAEMREHIATQRINNKKPSLNTFSADFAREVDRLPGIVSQTQMIEGRKTIQYLFHWEQKEKELQAVRMDLIEKGASPEQQEQVLLGIGEKFDNSWANKYGR